MKRVGSSVATGPAAKRPRVENGRGWTNGYVDPLRKYEGTYAGSANAEKLPRGRVAREMGKSGDPAKNPNMPKRDAKTQILHFDHFPEFQPNLSPDEVIKLGSFGGTYFRDIYSSVTKRSYKGSEVLEEFPSTEWGWQDSVDVQLPIGVGNTPCVNKPQKGKFQTRLLLTSDVYRVSQNRFNVSCGGSLDMWETSCWISDLDPYGWFHWYCRFYLGRRTSDDERQIQRWLNSAGPKGRFRNQLLNKCAIQKKAATDPTVSPVIRQTLQHWALEIKLWHKK